MSGSFSKIDYSIRPAKYAERRMLRDIFRRTSAFEASEDYVYVGFGSVWFADFTLFHRSFGVREMISIESSKAAEQRVRDNAPYKIELAFDRATKVLPTLPWHKRQFIWLDYDDALTPEMLRDIRTCATNSRSGTLLAVSVRCSAAREVDQALTDDGDQPKTAMERFRESFQASQIPEGTFEDDLSGWPYASLINSMIAMEIESALAVRNSKGPEPRFNCRKVCTFNYQDGAMMTTYVALIYSEDEQELASACGFEALPFMQGEDPVMITIPKLTPREFKFLESQLPKHADQDLNLGSIPAAEAKAFHRMYRYLPTFVVAEN